MKALLYLVDNKKKILFLFYPILLFLYMPVCFVIKKKERVLIWMNREVGRIQKEMGKRKTYSEYLVWKKNQFLI